MTDTRPTSIFLSHKRHDAGEVAELQTIIEAHGLGTWRDLRDLAVGSPTEAEVIRVIENEAEAFLLYLTKRSLAPGFIWDVEVPAAVRRRRHEPTFPLIPIARGLAWSSISARAQELGFADVVQSAGISVPGRLPGRGSPPSQQTISRFVELSDRVLRTTLASGLRRAGRGTDYVPRIALLTDPGNAGGNLDLVLNWQPMFSGRRPTRLEWDAVLTPALRSVQAAIANASAARTVKVPLQARLPAAIAFGYAFRLVTSFAVIVESRGREWDSRMRGDGSQPLQLRFRSGPTGAADVSVELSISEDVTGEAERALARAGISVSRRLCLAPTNGPSTASVNDAVHGMSMVEQVAQLLRQLRNDPAVATIHFFMAGPAPLALFLGQRFNTLGPLNTYQRADDGAGHVPAWMLPRTG